MRAVLKAQINKTDRNDARGIAQMMRVGLYRPVHVKTLRSQKLRMLLTHRKLLQSKAIAVEPACRWIDVASIAQLSSEQRTLRKWTRT
jgi:transposase